MNPLFLFLIYRTDGPAGYDEYDSAVVCAATKEEAQAIHPSSFYNSTLDEFYKRWTQIENVRVKLLGIAKPGTEKGVICASFRNG